MRNVIFSVANSLDNFIARTDDAVDWLLWNDEVKLLLSEYWKRFDTILMGRGTYEFGMREGKHGHTAMKTYVFARSIPPMVDGNIEIIGGDAVKFVRQLKAQQGKDICLLGGARLAQTLFNADLIDEIGLNIHPVLLGSGVPLFLDLDRQLDLELIESRPFSNGCVYVSYRRKR